MNETGVITERALVATGGSLVDYDRQKLELAGLVQQGLRLLEERKFPESHRRWRDLLSTLVDDRFTLAVLGQFNRGKSSLMNALLGLDRLPVGLVPLTSVITKVSYGNPERVIVEYMGTSLQGEIRLDQLPDYVTETGNPGNKKRIASVEVKLRSEFLRHGLYFVDTPGVGSALTANTLTTERFLPQADAVIFVTSFDSPLGCEEIAFLRKVQEHVRKIFFVVNKLDLVLHDQQEQILSFIREHLQQEMGVAEPNLYAVSALAGLKARLSGSSEELKKSGLCRLEDDLIRFLTTEKTREFLIRCCDRALACVAELDLTVLQGDQAPLWKDLTNRLGDMRVQCLGGPDGRARGTRLGTKLERFNRHADLMEAAGRRCLVCERVTDVMLKFMARFQYQIVMDEKVRNALAGKGGLCPLHTWQYSEIASPQGVSAAYPSVLLALSDRLRTLEGLEPYDGNGPGLASLVVHGQSCRACQEQATAEENVILEIVESARPAGTGQWPVVCLPHYRSLREKLSDPQMARSLAEFQADLLERLAENMARYAIKHDALRSGYASGDERVAYHRALSQLVGEKMLQAPWRVERLV